MGIADETKAKVELHDPEAGVISQNQKKSMIKEIEIKHQSKSISILANRPANRRTQTLRVQNAKLSRMTGLPRRVYTRRTPIVSKKYHFL